MISRQLPTLPPSLAQFAENIQRTIKKAINVKLTPVNNLLPWQSKIGGTPYLPLSADYPRSIEGDPLKLLAQINFSETPQLEGYPEKGILQFYISAIDEFYGMGSDFEDKRQKHFRVSYFENVEEDLSKLITEVPFRIDNWDFIDLQNDKRSSLNLPIDGKAELSMEFEIFQQYMTSNDYRHIVDVFGSDPNQPLSDSLETVSEECDQLFCGGGHQIGGYPGFTQWDPRENCAQMKGYELLFQLDSEPFVSDGFEILWGDSGIGNFFILPEDLAKRDFSKVAYNWDCC